ncbi:Phosphocarrier protein kinase/phosphorylase,nitrogen regulation associated [Candidatus Phaeomarinobacter ectocarpi]|uniref:phosphoenolpyruvate--protein phosphotransferase n=1 Tax=Candidatus Phaeomarinibacter ectocarpi TaxID=1458461 RepID=X5MEA8_9HYPH|nr:phosphoenolpyruvate--protein phosphotransferase [Candidatus Phaeomarinobacter ectocarpi]CDO59129.1 Phosphocarrier protein kinase/phosphorylase,nitrogen regulation associated [Candidatus Phaeomarinobacter ectocarpi]
MAQSGSADDRLQAVVRLIASNMVAEVCSIYLLQPDNRLELFATEGLRAEAVHNTFLALGEGLVGTVAQTARPLALSHAQQHPAFAHRPETGEDPYLSYLGVPLLRSGRVLGVLAVQNATTRAYKLEEMEALETVAMVLAEMVASGELVNLAALHEAELVDDRAMHHHGVAISEGIALGHAVLHQPRFHVTKIIAEDTGEELGRIEEAIGQLRAQVDAMLSGDNLGRAGEHREILETYRMFANDRGWLARLREAIESGLTAEAAVERVQNETRARLMRQTDPYLRERLHDLDDLANRLLSHLVGVPLTAAGDDLPTDAIIIARNMGPAELLDYDSDKLRALVLEEGSATAHVSIVARALGIPMIGRVEGITDLLEAGDAVIADGDTGEVYALPSSEIVDSYSEKARFRAKRQAQFRELRDKPAVTKDGIAVSLTINAGLMVDLPHLHEAGADGIGLFRTELQFLIASAMPKLSEQQAFYTEVLDEAGDKPVTFRTLDVGGDKVLPYLAHAKEENPALGWRAIRIALDRPGLLRYQLRALLQAAAGRNLRLMFPMVAQVSEFQAARELLDKELARLQRLGHPRPLDIKVGSMLEVPSLAWQLDALLPLVDFISIGSNDLLQFFFASDRGNPRVGDRYDLLSPAVLSFLQHVVAQCGVHDVPVSLCGEMAGRPLEAMTLVALGFRTLSIPPAAVGPVKAMILELDAGKLADFVNERLSLPDSSLRSQLAEFAFDNKIPL